ncbi:hypothetical protein CNR22_24165 [Sphingobacteriaceae bacterium]|nr:hypothetical protein CNR22_24165 [Sphingobacteriaceae bacterium]
MEIKKTVISFFLIMVFFLITGRFLVFMGFLESQKPAFRNYIILNQLSKTVSIKLASEDLFKDKNGLYWQDDNKELVKSGSYFEIVCIKLIKDSAVVFILEDANETRLFQKFFCLTTTNTSLLVEFIKLLSNLSFLSFEDISLKHFFSLIKKQNTHIFFKPQQFHAELIKPPKFQQII